MTLALETILDGTALGDLIHGDIAGRDMVIGNTDPDAPERTSIPILYSTAHR